MKRVGGRSTTSVTVIILVAATVAAVVAMRAMSLSPAKGFSALMAPFGAASGQSVRKGPGGGAVAKLAHLDKMDLLDEVRFVANELSDIEKAVQQLAQQSQPGGVSPSNNSGSGNQSAAGALSVSRQPLARKGSFPVQRRTKHSASKYSPPQDVEDTIFVSVASYRDDECAPTIEDMFDKAKNPRALFIGAVEQHEPQDPPCTPAKYKTEECQQLPFCPSDNIAARRIRPIDARGPTFGRYMGMLMYRGEKYYMMIDSHNRFVTHWDAIVIRVYKSAPSPKAVLSHYPEAWNHPKDKQAANAPLDNRPTTTFLCDAKFTELGYVKLNGFVVSRSQIPRLQPWAAAGFLFADARLTQEVPFDPYLDYVFDGEEILYSVRMWTHGWDIYSPSENILYHYYYRVGAKRFWDMLPNNWLKRREAAHMRIQWYLGAYKENSSERMVPLDTREESVLKENERYGLGKVRTLEDWYKFAGVDRVKRQVEKKWCR